MKVYKLTHLPEILYGETACFYSDESLDGITSELEVSEIGEKYQIEVVEMDKQDFAKLPEFEGF